MKFNINDTVKVKLTATGLGILKKQAEEVKKVFPEFVFTPPITDDEGFVEFQLWTLMQNFGEYMHNGNMELPFDTDILIRINSDKCDGDCDELKKAEERASYWEQQAERYSDSSEYYQKELAKAHEILGRVIHQLSERCDTVNLTSYFPTDNLWHKRTLNKPTGK